MTRFLCLASLFTFLSAPAVFSQTQKSTAPEPSATAPSKQDVPEGAMPPEEDESVAPEKFTLDPLESDRNVKVGNFYWHKGDYRAALSRYERATKFNPGSAEAFFKVGEAEQKLKNKDAAKLAFQRVVQLAPADSKLAHEAKKKLGSKS